VVGRSAFVSSIAVFSAFVGSSSFLLAALFGGGGDLSTILVWSAVLNSIAWLLWVLPSFVFFDAWSKVPLIVRVVSEVVVACVVINSLFLGVVLKVWYISVAVVIEVVVVEGIREWTK
jgi:hypothetical protein